MQDIIQFNKEATRFLYEDILNNRKFELCYRIISEDYRNTQGEQGIEAFKKGIVAITKAFPDARWSLTDIIAEGNNVLVKQTLKGTHKEIFQNIAPTNTSISNEGVAMYVFKDGKIISHQILTDRLGFLQQVGVLPADLTTLSRDNTSNVIFVDKFIVPKNAIAEFRNRMTYNRNFIKTLPGFMKDDVIAFHAINEDLHLLTIAVWQNQGYLDKAKKLVEAEYKKINFNPREMTDRLNIKMERQEYNFHSS